MDDELWAKYPIRCTTEDSARLNLYMALSRLELENVLTPNPQVKIACEELAAAIHYHS